MVFDSGPLRHFATHGWYGVLPFLAGERPIYIPETVERELINAISDVSAIRTLLDEPWLKVDRSADLGYLAVFSRYSERLAVGRQNLGECGVLAMGEFYHCEVVIDDSEARAVAEEMDLLVTATVPLLCQAIRSKRLTVPMVEAVADDLISGEYYLPFDTGGFRQHVLENGLLDYEELS